MIVINKQQPNSFGRCLFMDIGGYMKINKLISFYKDLYKDLDIGTINTPTFKYMLEFDILIRFDYRTNNKQINRICKAIINNNTRRYKNV